jgi:guanylate cyclase
MVVSAPLILGNALGELGWGRPWMTAISIFTVSYLVAAVVALRLKPQRWAGILGVVFFLAMIDGLAETILLGGIDKSSATVVFGLLAVLGALVVFSMKAAVYWFSGFVVAVVVAAVLPNWIDAQYDVEGSSGDLAFNIVAVTTLAFATMAYFVRQRDRFQKESDDLLHNILPDEIANRLKADNTMIADYYTSASVLFADVVDFTPMSAELAPSELVGLLNDVFSTFDGFVEELGLEKIKTVGDAYMAAAGVPVSRPDHAHLAAELALRIRDHVAASEFGGHRMALRIGINSGPVVAGIIGTNKFAYDLWGDTVNTASRMESGGLAGSIQVSAATRELIRNEFDCEPRGVVSVKGIGEMDTYILISKRAEAPTAR